MATPKRSIGRALLLRLVSRISAILVLICTCSPLGEFIIGRVIKAMNNSWHPDCFCCDICQAVLADVGFVKNAGRYEDVHSVRGRSRSLRTILTSVVAPLLS